MCHCDSLISPLVKCIYGAVTPSPKTNYVDLFSEILNLKGHPNCIAGLKVKAILLNGLILPIGGASSGRIGSQPAK